MVAKRILVHACCGPCALEPVAWLKEQGYEPTIFWANANIQPMAEYQKRKQTLARWASGEGLEVIEAQDDEEARRLWEERVAPFGFERKARCRACYALRLGQAAKAACDWGFERLATTLAVSPYQLFESCAEVLGALASAHGLEALWHDWRPRYGIATQRARELGLYRQSYCGCRFSAAEAQRERQMARDARKAARRAAKNDPAAAKTL